MNSEYQTFFAETTTTTMTTVTTTAPAQGNYKPLTSCL